MNRILTKKHISEGLVKFEIRTSISINNIKTGQYIIIRMQESDPGISFPVIKTNPEKSTITIIVSPSDENSRTLSRLIEGSCLPRIDGPFGYQAQIEDFGTVLCIGDEQGILALFPIISSLRASGNRIFTVLSAQTKDRIVLQNEMSAVSDELITITDDGSFGERATICQITGRVLRNNSINQVFVVGSGKTIKETCSHTIKNNIATQAFLHKQKTIEQGGHDIFKVSICGNEKAVCVDGFNFNAYYPNFEEMNKRFGCVGFNTQNRCEVSDVVSIPA